MGKSGLTIQKEIEKKAYAKTPLGQAEKKMRAFYMDVELGKLKLTDQDKEKINKIREDNEKWQMEYIERTNNEHRLAVDAKLLESFNEEIALLEQISTANQQ